MWKVNNKILSNHGAKKEIKGKMKTLPGKNEKYNK